MQSPQNYLNELGIELACAVAPDETASIDARHRINVNYETYFVADQDRLAEFVAAPYRYTGRVTDPVSKSRFLPNAASPSRTHGGRLYYFASDTHVGHFEAMPDSFTTPMLSMIPKKTRDDS